MKLTLGSTTDGMMARQNAQERLHLREPGIMVPPGLVEAAIEIAKKRASMLEGMRGALTRGDDKAALRFARELCGMADDSPQLSHTPADADSPAPKVEG